ncbi:MAG: MBL fold metallo-hydrolase [Flavobacteriaceae bacterium]
MSARLRFTLLGCGSSPGVPRIGNDWGACDPQEPRNRRRRCSMLVERFEGGNATRVLVDTSPDMREQVLAADIREIDGVLYTHAHADHIHGIDDLRGFVINMRRRVDIYADETTMDRLHEGFGYCFRTPPGSDYPPILNAHRISAGREVTIHGAGGDITALPIRQQHGAIDSLAFRFGGVAYSPDVNALDDAALEALRGLDVWIVDALRPTPHPSHFSLDEALHWIALLKPKRAILTHMHIDLDYRTLCRTLPAGVEPAHDMLSFETAA